jgi:hypothetical protein
MIPPNDIAIHVYPAEFLVSSWESIFVIYTTPDSLKQWLEIASELNGVLSYRTQPLPSNIYRPSGVNLYTLSPLIKTTDVFEAILVANQKLTTPLKILIKYGGKESDLEILVATIRATDKKIKERKPPGRKPKTAATEIEKEAKKE